MIGEKIKDFRIKCGYTQKGLADKIYVTAQAVSRWENNEVEPSLSTLTELAKIFNISVSELLGEKKPEPEKVVEKEYVVKEQKHVLAVCRQCNKPIFESKDLRRKVWHTSDGGPYEEIYCSSCDEKNKQARKEELIKDAKSRRIKSFIFGPLAAIVTLCVFLFLYNSKVISQNGLSIFIGVISIIGMFTLVSCLIFNNNFILDMVAGIASWGFIKCPGLIFSLDLDGIIWLLTVKLMFWILGFILGAIALAFAVVLGAVLSIIVYGYALRKNITRPEETND